jgi:hypothetical protein
MPLQHVEGSDVPFDANIWSLFFLVKNMFNFILEVFYYKINWS